MVFITSAAFWVLIVTAVILYRRMLVFVGSLVSQPLQSLTVCGQVSREKDDFRFIRIY